MNAWEAGAAAVLTAAGCWTDIRFMKIPNLLTAGFGAGGIFYHAATAGWPGAAWALTGGLAGMLPLAVLYWFGGIGAGDVKWFGAFGLWTGAEIVLRLLIFSVLAAGGIAACLLVLRLPGLRRLGQRIPWPWGRHPSCPGKGAVFPFMLAVVPGFVWLWASFAM